MTDYQYFHCLMADMANGKHNLATATLKVALANTAPLASQEKLADLSVIDTANLDSVTLTTVSSSQSGGTYRLVVADKLITATGVVPSFRYVIVYNDSSVNKSLICFYDYGESRTMSQDESLNLDFNQEEGLFYITLSVI
jgi:hypothetical protein